MILPETLVGKGFSGRDKWLRFGQFLLGHGFRPDSTLGWQPAKRPVAGHGLRSPAESQGNNPEYDRDKEIPIIEYALKRAISADLFFNEGEIFIHGNFGSPLGAIRFTATDSSPSP